MSGGPSLSLFFFFSFAAAHQVLQRRWKRQCLASPPSTTSWSSSQPLSQASSSSSPSASTYSCDSDRVASPCRLHSVVKGDGERTAEISKATDPVITSKQNRLGEGFHAVVIGGGIGGLAAALAMQIRGVRCTVYERDDSFESRRQGYGLTLTNNPNGALAKLGILQECIRQDCNSNAHWVFNPEGKILGYYGRAFKSSDRSVEHGNKQSKHRGNLRIPRQDLRRMLFDRLHPGTVKWSHRCVSIQNIEESEKLEVAFSNGETLVADLVVGADGIRSFVRQTRKKLLEMPPELRSSSSIADTQLEDIQYIGVTVILGISSFQDPLLARQGYYVIDGTHRLFTMPYRENKDGITTETMWQLSFSGLSDGTLYLTVAQGLHILYISGESSLLKIAGPKAQLMEARRRTSGWFECARELINQTHEENIWSTPLFDSKLTHQAKSFKSEKAFVTLIGDAFHPMSMFKGLSANDASTIKRDTFFLFLSGQGANQALEDAPRLVQWLLREGKQFSSLSLSKRMMHFEKEMMDRTKKWVLSSRDASNRLHSDSVFLEENAYKIDGLTSQMSSKLLERLEERGVSASRHEGTLEESVSAEYKWLLNCK